MERGRAVDKPHKVTADESAEEIKVAKRRITSLIVESNLEENEEKLAKLCARINEEAATLDKHTENFHVATLYKRTHAARTLLSLPAPCCAKNLAGPSEIKRSSFSCE